MVFDVFALGPNDGGHFGRQEFVKFTVGVENKSVIMADDAFGKRFAVRMDQSP